jgi:hypothetical protein
VVHSSQLNQLAAANLQNPKKPFHDDFQMVKNPIWIHLENREIPMDFSINFHQLPIGSRPGHVLKLDAKLDQ